MNPIETHSLTRRFGCTEAVHELDLVVPAGSVTALLGANGAGKTTTLKLLMNLLRPTSGSAMVLGVPSERLGEGERARIGYVSENQEMPRWMTVRQLLDFCRPFYPTWDRDLERKLLAQFELPEERKLSALSRGMLMKAALLSSLAYRPQLLVLDEPFSGLDPLVREDFIRGVLEVSDAGEWTVLVSSHDIEEVERLADRIALMDAGRLELQETAEALLGRFRRVELTQADANATPVPEWLGWERAGGLIRFVETRYAGDETERSWRARFPAATINAQPMSLREIFIAHARSRRRAGEESAA
jgi:ABC-2 type transport system ATP-binding protein